MEMGGEVDIFGYADGGMVQYMEDGGEITSGITRARDSAGDVVPGMFVARYSDGTYSKPVTASNIEGLRQGIISGRVTSGDYTADEASSMAAKDLYLKRDNVSVVDRDVSGGFGSPLGMSNEMLGNDMVFVQFADGTKVTAQKGMIDAMNQAGLLDSVQSRDDFNKTMLDLSAGSVDPESQAAQTMQVFYDNQERYNNALRESDPNIQRNIDAFRGYYAPQDQQSAVDSSDVNPIDYTQFTGDVGNFSNTGENFSLYGPQLNIPQSVSQYMTDPVTGGLTTSYGP